MRLTFLLLTVVLCVRSTAVDPYTLALRSGDRDKWWTTIGVGTPPQSIDVTVNFAEPETYVPNNQFNDGGDGESCCASSTCSDKVFCKATCYPRCCGKLADPTHSGCIFGYDKRFSSTYAGNASTYCLSGYCSGRECVYAANDTIRIIGQSLNLENFRFGTIYRVTSCLRRDGSSSSPARAQLGLGKPIRQPDRWVFGHESVLSRLANQEKMKMMFTLWVNDTARGLYNAELTLGALNREKCGALSYAPFQLMNSEIVVPLNGLRFGSVISSLPNGFHYNMTMLLQPIPVGMTYFPLVLNIGSKMILDEIRKSVGADDGGRMNCSTKVYAVPPERFFVKDDFGCYLNLAVDEDDESRWALGPAFAQQFCIVVDYDNNRLGFAENLIV